MTDKPLDLTVLVHFGRDIASDTRAVTLLRFEHMLRTLTGLPIEVFMQAKGDDSKLRAAMTLEQRSRL